jgi:DNA (cytosine-5)-methyltransferase 1
MAWIYFQESAASDSPSNLGLEQSPIVSKTDMHRAFYCRVCNRVTLIERQSGTTLELCEKKTCRELTLSTADFHAKTLALLAKVSDLWRVSEAAFILKLKGLSKKQTHDLYFSKMSLQLELGGLAKSQNHLPKSGMIVDGQLFQPKALAHHISAKDGSYWLTPTATAIGVRGPAAMEYRKKWRASSGRKSVPPGNLAEQVAMSGDTPISDMTKSEKWPTPNARDWKDSITQTYRGEGSRDDSKLVPLMAKRARLENQELSGQLNPAWVEWLMGYKIGFTELSVSATAWYLSKRKSRLKS